MAVTVICVYWSEWAAPSAAVRVRFVRVFVPGTGFGLKEADIPVGRPVTEKETSPFDPLRRFMSTGTSTEVPVRTSTTVWPGFRVKSAGCGPSGVVTETSSMARYLPSGPSGASAITSK